jgi:hypothetical protein
MVALGQVMVQWEGIPGFRPLLESVTLWPMPKPTDGLQLFW